MVRCLAVNSEFLVSGGDDRTVRVWRKSAPEQHLEPLRGHDDFVRAVALCSTITHHLATAADDRRLLLWDARSGERLRTFPQLSSSGTCLALRESLLLVGGDKQLRVWHTASGEEHKSFR